MYQDILGYLKPVPGTVNIQKKITEYNIFAKKFSLKFIKQKSLNCAKKANHIISKCLQLLQCVYNLTGYRLMQELAYQVF